MTECEKDENGNYIPLIGHLYQYDDLDRPYMQQSIFEYTAADGVTREDFVAYYYEYADYAGTGSATSNVGELTQYEILGAGLSADSAITYGYDELYRMTTKTLSVSSIVSLTAKYEYTNTTQVKSYTSTVSNGVSELENSYSYTYNISGNIIRIVDSNDQAIVYKYDDVGQLVRENNEPLGETYVYTYDNAGNRTSKTTYDYTTDSVDSLTPIETQTYTYSAGAWGDQLSLIQTNGTITAMFSYDAIGNPIVYNGYLMTWDGRRLMTANGSGNEIAYAYNSDGLRTRKTVNGVDHIYTLEGSRIVTEAWGDNLLIYLYDESGAPIGMQYRNTTYAKDRFDTFYFEKNLQGDIVAVYNSMGDPVVYYSYDAWGNQTITWRNSYGPNFNASYNPFRYRGYYYDTETGFYYLQSRYYNPQWGRFLNADSYLSTGTGLIGFNMYAYCDNNPVMYVDPYGTSYCDCKACMAGLPDECIYQRDSYHDPSIPAYSPPDDLVYPYDAEYTPPDLSLTSVGSVLCSVITMVGAYATEPIVGTVFNGCYAIPAFVLNTYSYAMDTRLTTSQKFLIIGVDFVFTVGGIAATYGVGTLLSGATPVIGTLVGVGIGIGISVTATAVEYWIVDSMYKYNKGRY